MKVVIKIFAAWLAIWGLGYIAGSFTAASFDITQWSESSRSLIALMSTMFCGLCVPVIFATEGGV